MKAGNMFYQYVIVGGGAGGLELAARLGRKLGRHVGRNKVLLIDKNPYHIWKPTLHEVAVGTLNPQQEGLYYNTLARRNHFSFMLGDAIDLNHDNKSITLKPIYSEHDSNLVVPERTIYFNRCVLAMGSGSNFFNTPGAAEHAYVLENVNDAQRFQLHLLNLFTKSAYTPKKSLDVTIIGAGATGVELSAELIEAHQEILQTFRPSQRFDIHIHLIESAPRILAGLPEHVSEQATYALQEKGITVSTATKALEIGPDFVRTESDTLQTDVVVWAAGIKASEHNKQLGLATNHLNQFQVSSQLQTSADGVYAMGDCASCQWEEGRFVPARAQAARQQAIFLSKLLYAHNQNTAFTESFVYKDAGSLVSLGDNKGVGNLMGSLSGKNFFIQGLIAKWMYMSLHLMHHQAILGTPKTALLAFARLVHRRVSGRLKLH